MSIAGLAKAGLIKLDIHNSGIDKYGFTLASGETGTIITKKCHEIAVFNREVIVNTSSHMILFTDSASTCEYSVLFMDK